MNRVFKVLIAILAISVVLITGIPMLRSDALALDETSPTTVYAGPGSNVVLNRNPGTSRTAPWSYAPLPGKMHDRDKKYKGSGFRAGTCQIRITSVLC